MMWPTRSSWRAVLRACRCERRCNLTQGACSFILEHSASEGEPQLGLIFCRKNVDCERVTHVLNMFFTRNPAFENRGFSAVCLRATDAPALKRAHWERFKQGKVVLVSCLACELGIHLPNIPW